MLVKLSKKKKKDKLVLSFLYPFKRIKEKEEFKTTKGLVCLLLSGAIYPKTNYDESY